MHDCLLSPAELQSLLHIVLTALRDHQVSPLALIGLGASLTLKGLEQMPPEARAEIALAYQRHLDEGLAGLPVSPPTQPLHRRRTKRPPGLPPRPRAKHALLVEQQRATSPTR